MPGPGRDEGIDFSVKPLLVVLIPDLHRNRGAGRLARHHSSQNVHCILFDLHPWSSAEAALPAGKFFVDDFNIY